MIGRTVYVKRKSAETYEQNRVIDIRIPAVVSTEPGSAPKLLAELDEKLDAIGVGRIVDGVGRGVALDRDKNYDKVKRAYDAMVDGAGTRYE